jgi:aryl-alcohol dehydrogenase-like predicted oxidoreductase
VTQYLTDENFAVLDKMEMIAQAHNASLAEVAIAWLRDRPSVVAPIASATSLEQMKSLIRGAQLKLSDAEIALLS